MGTSCKDTRMVVGAGTPTLGWPRGNRSPGYLVDAEWGVGGLDQGLGSSMKQQECLGAGVQGRVGGHVLIHPLQPVGLGHPKDLQLRWQEHGIRGVPITPHCKDKDASHPAGTQWEWDAQGWQVGVFVPSFVAARRVTPCLGHRILRSPPPWLPHPRVISSRGYPIPASGLGVHSVPPVPTVPCGNAFPNGERVGNMSCRVGSRLMVP